MISIIDYGVGNLRSVQKAFELYTANVRIITSPEEIDGSTVLILPGDGAFGMSMDNLRSGGWIDRLYSYIHSGRLFVGICVGFQLLFEYSEEFGRHKGLGIIKGDIKKFSAHDRKVPHMGWNTVSIEKKCRLMDGIKDNSYFYFIHTYHPETDDDVVVGRTEYGIGFPSIVKKDNVFGTQFHPEKSHSTGLKIIENIVRDSC
ncbi:MAG: imidazole glycerol phosphate synthase subunit HisH [Spirochaetota bacterium]